MGVTLLMGVLVFFVGLVMEILSLMVLLKLPPVADLGAGQQLILFIGGTGLIILGYFMARNFPPAATTYIEEAPETEPPVNPQVKVEIEQRHEDQNS